MSGVTAAQDPLRLVATLWPDVTLYRQQREIVRSVWENDETYVPACHMGGKDFTAALVILVFFLTRHPCRIVTTSVDHKQLEGVLWGEMRRFIQTSKYPLDYTKGGPLVLNHLHIRKVVRGEVDGLSYIMGRVAERGEGMSGHHIAQTGDGIPRTLGVSDEASGVDEETCEKMSEWANRLFFIGNTYDCANRFKWAIKGRPGTKQRGGDIPRDSGDGYHRKIIRIRAEDTPNVQYGLAQRRAGIEPTNEILIPGVLPYNDYVYRLRTWDAMKQCVGLGADFYEGSEIKLFPTAWLNAAEQRADLIRNSVLRRAKGIGCDTGEGSAETSFCAVDEYGVVELVARPTPDTSVIEEELLAFMHKHSVPPERVCIDLGGGGKQLGDRLRAQDKFVRLVGFGSAVAPDPKRGFVSDQEKLLRKEERYAYMNRRAQMYGELSELLDPSLGAVFSIPVEHHVLRSQLEPIPKTYKNGGRLYIEPKPELIKRIGCSPDRADSLVLAVHAMLHEADDFVIGAF